MADLNQSMCNLALQLQQPSYLHYYNVFGNETWQGGDLPWGAPTHKIKWAFYYVVFQYIIYIYIYIHYHSAHGHQTWKGDDLPW